MRRTKTPAARRSLVSRREAAEARNQTTLGLVEGYSCKRDQDQYTEWCDEMHLLLIAADDLLAEMKKVQKKVQKMVEEAGPEGVPAKWFGYGLDTGALAKAMQVAAREVRDMADYLDRVVETGFADGEIQPIATGPEKPQ